MLKFKKNFFFEYEKPYPDIMLKGYFWILWYNETIEFLTFLILIQRYTKLTDLMQSQTWRFFDTCKCSVDHLLTIPFIGNTIWNHRLRTLHWLFWKLSGTESQSTKFF